MILNSKRKHLPLLLPLYVYYTLFLVVPLIALFVISFWERTSWNLIPAFTLSNYLKIFSKSIYYSLMLRSILMGFIIAVVCVILSYPLAYALTFRFTKRQDVVLYLILISLFSSYLVRIYAWKTILGKFGLINQIFSYLHIIKEPLEFLLYSRTAVIVTLVFIFTPFTLLPIYSSLQNVSIEVIEAAKDLGANNFKTLLKITIPLSMPGIIAGFIFTFLLSTGDYVTPQLVGGTSGMMIGKVIADQFGIVYNWPFGSAIAYFLIFVMIFVVLVFITTLNKCKLYRQ
jgi:spermidine/putrescine transport system permease protein